MAGGERNSITQNLRVLRLPRLEIAAGIEGLGFNGALLGIRELVHRLISGRHTAVGDLADFQGAERRAY
jgi:hypothetical protein